jgi:hypothetical protein
MAPGLGHEDHHDHDCDHIHLNASDAVPGGQGRAVVGKRVAAAVRVWEGEEAPGIGLVAKARAQGSWEEAGRDRSPRVPIPLRI